LSREYTTPTVTDYGRLEDATAATVTFDVEDGGEEQPLQHP
jgi:hypothetical protein